MKKLFLTLFTTFGLLAAESSFAQNHTPEDSYKMLVEKIFSTTDTEWAMRETFVTALDKIIPSVVIEQDFNDEQKATLLKDVIALNELVRAFHHGAVMAAGHDEWGNSFDPRYTRFYDGTQKLYDEVTKKILQAAFMAKVVSRLNIVESIDAYICFHAYSGLMNDPVRGAEVIRSLGVGSSYYQKFKKIFEETLNAEKNKIEINERNNSVQNFKKNLVNYSCYRSEIDKIVAGFDDIETNIGAISTTLDTLVNQLTSCARSNTANRESMKSPELFNPVREAQYHAVSYAPSYKDNIRVYVLDVVRTRLVALGLQDVLNEYAGELGTEGGDAAAGGTPALMLRYAPSPAVLRAIQDQALVQRELAKAQRQMEKMQADLHAYLLQQEQRYARRRAYR